MKASEFDVNEYNSHECDIHNHGYYLGAQSQQAKIDELQKQVITQGQNFNDQAQKLKDTEYFNQKLQARVDATEKWIESNKKNIPLSEWHGYTTEEYVDADDLLEILKGNKDEN